MQDTAYLWNQLMTGLGFATYVAQGGDLGSYLSWQLARDYSECVGESPSGFHSFATDVAS
jgi:hypothetical protein